MHSCRALNAAVKTSRRGMAETNPSPSVFEYMMPHFVSCPYCGEKMNDSPQTVYTASYNIRELLDTKLVMKWGRALTLLDLI